MQWTHGGINSLPPGSPHFLNHDPLTEDEFFNAGFGTGFALTPDLTVFVTYMHGFDGQNDHKVDQSMTVGISYGYRPRAEAVGLAAAESNEPRPRTSRSAPGWQVEQRSGARSS